MEKIQSKVVPQNQPSLEEWLKEFKVGSTYNRFDVKKEYPNEKNYIKNIIKIFIKN